MRAKRTIDNYVCIYTYIQIKRSKSTFEMMLSG